MHNLDRAPLGSVHTAVCQPPIRLAGSPEESSGDTCLVPLAQIRLLEFPVVELDSTWLIFNRPLRPFPSILSLLQYLSRPLITEFFLSLSCNSSSCSFSSVTARPREICISQPSAWGTGIECRSLACKQKWSLSSLLPQKLKILPLTSRFGPQTGSTKPAGSQQAVRALCLPHTELAPCSEKPRMLPVPPAPAPSVLCIVLSSVAVQMLTRLTAHPFPLVFRANFGFWSYTRDER